MILCVLNITRALCAWMGLSKITISNFARIIPVCLSVGLSVALLDGFLVGIVYCLPVRC